MTAEGIQQKRRPGLLSLPRTQLGKWSARLLVLSLVLALVNSVAVMPITEQNAGLELLQTAFNLFAGFSLVSAGIVGLLAWVMRGDRSWVIVLSMLLLVVVIAMMLQDLTTPG